jgi:hypothetical protein
MSLQKYEFKKNIFLFFQVFKNPPADGFDALFLVGSEISCWPKMNFSEKFADFWTFLKISKNPDIFSKLLKFRKYSYTSWKCRWTFPNSPDVSKKLLFLYPFTGYFDLPKRKCLNGLFWFFFDKVRHFLIKIFNFGNVTKECFMHFLMQRYVVLKKLFQEFC